MQANLQKRPVTLAVSRGERMRDEESTPESAANVALHRWLITTRQRELMLTGKDREQAAIDEDYYDGEQWAEDDKIVLEGRGQAPLVFNELKPAIDWVLGEEKRKRMDFNVYGRAEDDAESAIAKQKLIKYLSDVNRIGWQRSEAFASCVKAGEGWTELCVEPDDAGEPTITFRYVPWRNIVADSSSRELDGSDRRYLFRDKIVDFEEAAAWFPELKTKLYSVAEERDVLENVQMAESYLGSPLNRTGFLGIGNPGMLDMGSRPAIQLYECWYKRYESVEVIRRKGHRLHGKVYNNANEDHLAAIESGVCQVFKTVRASMRVAIFCDKFLIVDCPSPYEHNKFPFVRRTAYRKAKNGATYGLIRQIRDIQDDLNKRMSKAQHALSVRRVTVDPTAVDDMATFVEEVARPDAVLEVNDLNKVRIEEGVQLADAQVALAEKDSIAIRNISGVTGEAQGRETNATSGIAQRQRAEQGGIITTTLFDNNRLAHQLEGEILLSLIEQFMTDEQEIRIIGDNGKPEYISINSPGSTRIADNQCDFIVDEEDYRIGVKAQLSDRLMDIATRFAQIGQPQIATSLVVMAFELQDLPNRERLLSQIREMTNMPDPNEPDDKRMARKEAEAENQRQQRELEMRKVMADILKAEGEAKKAQADAGMKETQDLKEKLIAFEQAMKSAKEMGNTPRELVGMVDDLIQNVTHILAAQPVPPAPQIQTPPASVQAQPPMQPNNPEV